MSLRSGLILAFAGMIVFSMVIAGLALMFLLRGYQDSLTENRMRDLSRPLFFRIANAGRDSPRGLSPARVAEALFLQAGDLAVVGMVVDDDGNVRLDTSPEQSFIGHRLSLESPASGPGNPEGVVSGIFRGPDGNRYVYASSRLTFRADGESRVLNLVLATPSVDITRGLGNLVRVLAAAGAVALAGAVLLALVIARRLTRPLQRLEASTRDVAAGNYDRQAPVEGAREIQSLARSFNGMTRRVRNARQRQRNFLANVSHELRTPLTSSRASPRPSSKVPSPTAKATGAPPASSTRAPAASSAWSSNSSTWTASSPAPPSWSLKTSTWPISPTASPPSSRSAPRRPGLRSFAGSARSRASSAIPTASSRS